MGRVGDERGWWEGRAHTRVTTCAGRYLHCKSTTQTHTIRYAAHTHDARPASGGPWIRAFIRRTGLAGRIRRCSCGVAEAPRCTLDAYTRVGCTHGRAEGPRWACHGQALHAVLAGLAREAAWRCRVSIALHAVSARSAATGVVQTGCRSVCAWWTVIRHTITRAVLPRCTLHPHGPLSRGTTICVEP